MKFGKDLKKQKVPEWTEAYVDYNGLKRILHEIQIYERNKPNPRASQKRLFKDFSASFHENNQKNQGDIEKQVISVHAVQQANSRKLYRTHLHVSSEEGEENEIDFFKKLDDELNKTNNFCKDKMEEVISEVKLLKKQMEALIALRIKVRNLDLETSKDVPPRRTETVGG